MRTIVIGDIHGCLDALRGLVMAIAPMPEDRLIFLGDYVDRGPDSCGVIDYLIALEARCQVICLLGNHEIMFRSVLRGAEMDLWLGVGGQETLASYRGSLNAVPDSHRQFLDRLRLYFETEGFIFVHANYEPDLPMDQQDELTACWLHLTERLPAPHFSGKHVFVGHTPQSSGEVLQYDHLTCIDTYCVGGKWLTALDVGNEAILQVNPQGQLRMDRPQDAMGSQFWSNLKRFLFGSRP